VTVLGGVPGLLLLRRFAPWNGKRSAALTEADRV